jgi:hypothetical protein
VHKIAHWEVRRVAFVRAHGEVQIVTCIHNVETLTINFGLAYVRAPLRVRVATCRGDLLTLQQDREYLCWETGQITTYLQVFRWIQSLDNSEFTLCRGSRSFGGDGSSEHQC